MDREDDRHRSDADARVPRSPCRAAARRRAPGGAASPAGRSPGSRPCRSQARRSRNRPSSATRVSIIVLPTRWIAVARRSPRRRGCSAASGECVKSSSATWSVRTRLTSSGIVRSQLRRPDSTWATGIRSWRAGERRRERRVDVARHDHQIGLLGGQHRLDRSRTPRDLHRVRARSDAEHVVGLGHPELLEEDSTSSGRSAGPCGRCTCRPSGDRAQRADHRGHLDQVRAVPTTWRSRIDPCRSGERVDPRASSKSAAVSPPAAWVVIRTVTFVQEMLRSG